jgi:Na+/phosphate symporter
MITLITSLPILFMIVGAVLWLFSEKTGKWAELGRIMFAAGAFGLCFALGGKTVAILK